MAKLGPSTFQGRRRYQAVVADSARWDGFRHRDGDIVISTPPKCGTTWTQMLVALLVFDGPDLPDRLTRISPWLDMDTATLPEIRDRLEAQGHRRFIKTHVPLDGLPLDERVTYVLVGRDPRDAFLSMGEHHENLNFDSLMPILNANVGAEEMERRLAAGRPVGTLSEECAAEPAANHATARPPHVVQHLAGAWELRDHDNLVLLHYADLQADLFAEFRRLADALGFDVSDERLGQLAEHAGFAAMKGRASDLAPETDSSGWKSDTDFFRAGRMGAWASAFLPEELAAYEEFVTSRCPDEEFLAWLHGGYRGGEWRAPAHKS